MPDGGAETPAATSDGSVAAGASEHPGAGDGPTGHGGTIGGSPAPTLDMPGGGWSLSFAIDPDLAVPVASWSLSTAFGVILFAAFLPRPARRERAPVAAERAGPDVAASAAISTVELPVALLGARPVGAVGKAGVTSGPTNPGEATMPRWLRPTLQAQRQAGERGIPRIGRPPTRFDASRAPGGERRTITYRLVRLSSGPDELASDEVGRLDRGDEVEVIGEHEGFLQVRTPSGAEGWVPRVVILG